MENRKTVTLIVAAHKKFRMPEDPMYLPLQVGAAGKPDIGYTRDDTGENISDRNAQYSELTGLYWAWKNLNTDYIGLVHYRRYFRGRGRGKDPFEKILKSGELEPMLGKIRIFVPKKRRYYIETLQSHYEHTHFPEELAVMREVLAERDPGCLPQYDRVMKQTWGYMFNMFIMERSLLDDYCSWLFPLLFEITPKLERPGLTPFENRYSGRLSELLFNVWLARKIESGKVRRDEIRELPFIYMEKINVWEKAVAFLKAKFFHRKQSQSF